MPVPIHHVGTRAIALTVRVGLAAVLIAVIAAGIRTLGKTIPPDPVHPNYCRRGTVACAPGQVVLARSLTIRAREQDVAVAAHGGLEYDLVGLVGLPRVGPGRSLCVLGRFDGARTIEVLEVDAPTGSWAKAYLGGAVLVAWSLYLLTGVLRRG